MTKGYDNSYSNCNYDPTLWVPFSDKYVFLSIQLSYHL